MKSYSCQFRSLTSIQLGCAVAVAFSLMSLDSLAQGDVDRGKVLYAVCATCHGDEAQGMQDMNGPALAGREEWYLRRQLENFRSGARGTDSRDIYGLQMAPMAQLLQDEQAIVDVAAYLSSLE